MCCSAGDLILGIIAIFFPPLPVWIRRGLCSADSLINILLCVLGFIPGLIHAWYIISITPSMYEDMYYNDVERANTRTDTHVAYYIVDGQGQQHPAPKPGNTPSYGTSGPARSNKAAAPASNAQSGQSSRAAAPASAPAPAAGSSSHEHGEGSTATGPPPSYADVVQGDHKIQSNE